MIELIQLSWVLSLVGIIVLFFSKDRFKFSVTAFTTIATAAVTSWLAISALVGNEINALFNGGLLIGDIAVKVDKLSAWFILIINFTSITGVFYGNGYLKAYKNSSNKLTLHWILYLIFQASMLWVCMIQNGLVFLIVWEIMSLSSLMLVIFDAHKSKTIKAGLNYLVQMHISVIFLSIGVLWMYFQTGSFSFDALAVYFAQSNNIWLFLVFFIGFGLKAGFVPLHSWLPHAHPAAPSHVSGVMSGVIVKLGIYGIFRIISQLQNNQLLIGEIILIVSVVTGLYGILNAAMHRDFKKMLAYCTIENIGIIGLGIGLGLIGIGNHNATLYYLGFGGALLHVLNHSLFKSLLFFSAGSVYQQTHTRDMEKLGGLIKTMPKSAVMFLIGAVAIGGLPPFNGFISEFLIYAGMFEGIKLEGMSQIIFIVLSFAGLSIVGGLSILTFTKTFGILFLGTPRQELKHKPSEVSNSMLIPQYLIVAMMLFIALAPLFFIDIITNILATYKNPENLLPSGKLVDYFSVMQNISLYTLLFVSIILVLLFVNNILKRTKTITSGPTWGCGYTAGTSKIQYTGKSYSKSLGKIFSSIVIERKQYKEIQAGEIFPNDKRYISHYNDFVEYRLFHGILNRLLYSANYFKFIQNGRVQSYVLYGILFIIAVFLFTIF